MDSLERTAPLDAVPYHIEGMSVTTMALVTFSLGTASAIMPTMAEIATTANQKVGILMVDLCTALHVSRLIVELRKYRIRIMCIGTMANLCIK